MGEHIDNITSSLSVFIEIGVPKYLHAHVACITQFRYPEQAYRRFDLRRSTPARTC